MVNRSETPYNSERYLNFPEAGRIVCVASSLLGAPSVRYAGSDKGISPEDGFDCSGFVQYVLSEAGIAIPKFIVSGENNPREIRHTNEFFDYFGISIHGGLQKPGDLIFFSRTGEYPTHMGIVIALDLYIHAPGKTSSSVCCSLIEQSNISNISQTAIYNKNPIGFKRPTLPLINSTQRRFQKLI